MRVPMRRSDMERKRFLNLAKKVASVIARGAHLHKKDRLHLRGFLRHAPGALEKSLHCHASMFAQETERRFGQLSMKHLLDNLRRFPNFNRELGMAFIEWVIKWYGREAEARHTYFLFTRPDLPPRKRPLIWHLGEAYRRNG